MSDLKLIDKVAQRIYPSRLEEARTDSSFSWNTVLPSVAKHDLKDSVAHKESADRNTHTLTHRMKNGATLEFNMTGSGKQHIALAKYQNKGKLFTAIHSHEDPYKAMATAYQSVKRRMVTEDVEPTLIEKVAHRIEKKTGKLSTKKEKIDTEPTDNEQLKESKLSEDQYPIDTQSGILANLDYHHGREIHHRHAAEMSHRKAESSPFNSDSYRLHKSVAKGHEAVANHHRVCIADLHKRFSQVAESEQLDELSPWTLGNYIRRAAIDKGSHAASQAIDSMSSYSAEDRGDKKEAEKKKKSAEEHGNKQTKRFNGIMRATDKLVHKAVVKEDSIEEAAHPDRIVMTSSIRKDLGGGYMAKTKNGHYYKLDVKALGEPGKGRELPKIGSVLDTSKHRFIGKDKVDLGMLKESTENNYLGQLVGKYLTHSGKTGIEIRRHAIGTYSYSGEWGAGGGHSKTEMDKTANRLLRLHPRHKIEKKYYGDLHNIKEDLDHNHPDMKAYHAAVKASDEAHLKSIRYRMNHDIKQPEHRVKYDELEAEHHRLRDIEDQASEKVHGRLFAHHTGFKE